MSWGRGEGERKGWGIEGRGREKERERERLESLPNHHSWNSTMSLELVLQTHLNNEPVHGCSIIILMARAL